MRLIIAITSNLLMFMKPIHALSILNFENYLKSEDVGKTKEVMLVKGLKETPVVRISWTGKKIITVDEDNFFRQLDTSRKGNTFKLSETLGYGNFILPEDKISTDNNLKSFDTPSEGIVLTSQDNREKWKIISI